MLRTMVRLAIVLCTASVVALLPHGVEWLVNASSGVAIRVSGDVTLLPKSPDVVESPVAAVDSRIKVSATDAVASAEHAVGFSSAALNTTTGVVRSSVTLVGDHAHQNEPAWVVVVDAETRGTMSPAVSHHLCVVVDAGNGEYQFGYTCDYPSEGGIRNGQRSVGR